MPWPKCTHHKFRRSVGRATQLGAFVPHYPTFTERRLMARYYFHLKQANELVTDEEGQEWPTLEKARAIAVEAARELVAAR